MHRNALFAFAVLTAVVAGACGDADGGATSEPPVRRVTVKMVDIAYQPEELSVEKGQELRFVFVNEGKVRHEAYVGDADEQAEHEEAMKAGDGDGGGHDAHGGGNPKVTVDPGKEGDLTHRFEEAGTFEIGCHEPGHYDAGMVGEITIA